MKWYAIINIDDNELMWSNLNGWVSHPGFDLFNESEKASLNLPMGGQWVYMCGDDIDA